MKLKKFFLFRYMIMPIIVQLFFWLSLIIFLYVGIYGLWHHKILEGLSVLIGGPLVARLVCEYIIVLFRIHNILMEIKDKMLKQTI